MTLPWYKDGLKFSCTGCGKCCTGNKGFIFVTEEEIIEMASSIGLSIKDFKIRYIKNRNNLLSLVDKKNEKDEYSCIFLKNNQCAVYQARPKQCRTYPWWPENLHNEQSWQIAAQECEGIQDKASLISLEEIEKNLNS